MTAIRSSTCSPARTATSRRGARRTARRCCGGSTRATRRRAPATRASTPASRLTRWRRGCSSAPPRCSTSRARARGGGGRGGVSYGASDEWSFRAAVNPTYCYDLHATVLHLLGIDHERLTFRHNGIDRRLTDVHGHVIREILA